MMAGLPKSVRRCSHFFFGFAKNVLTSFLPGQMFSLFFGLLEKCSQKIFRGFSATNTFNREGELRQNYFYNRKSWLHILETKSTLCLVLNKTRSDHVPYKFCLGNPHIRWLHILFHSFIQGKCNLICNKCIVTTTLGTSTQLTNFPAPHVRWWTDP